MELSQILETWCKMFSGSQMTLSYLAFMLNITLYLHKYIEFSRKQSFKSKCRLFMINNSVLHVKSRLLASINEVAKKQIT